MNPNEFIIPNNSKKRDDIKLLEAGPNPGILYAIIDQGTHYNSHFDKTSRTVRLIFEFPLLKQLFKEDDTEARPTVVSQEYTFVLGEKSNLKKFIDGAEGRILQPNEYRDGWNLGQYLGRTFMVDIVNKPAKKDPSIIYNNIAGVKALTDSLRSRYNFKWDEITRTNDLVSFMIDAQGKCFMTETFSKLPNYLKKIVKESDEGLDYANNGGMFKEMSGSNGNSESVPQNSHAPNKPQASKPSISVPDGFEWLATDYTYEQYLASGWSNEQLVQNGKMKTVSKGEAIPQAPSKPQSPELDLDKVDDDEDDVPF